MINEENFNESQRAQCRFVANCVGNSRVSWQTWQRSRFRMTFAVVIFYILDAFCILGPGNQSSCSLCKCHTLKCIFLVLDKKKKSSVLGDLIIKWEYAKFCDEISWSPWSRLQVVPNFSKRQTSERNTRDGFLWVSLEIRDYSQSTVIAFHKTLLYDSFSYVSAKNAVGSANENMAAWKWSCMLR